MINNLSYSTISNYDRCPKIVYFDKILRIESIEPDYFKFGKDYHKAVENYHKGYKYDKKLIKVYTDEIPQDYYKKPKDNVEFWLKDHLRAGDQSTELPVIGVIDGVRSKELVDLKTSSGSISQRKVDESDQPTMYLTLWRQKFNKEMKFRYIIYNKKTGKIIERLTSRTIEECKDYFDHVKEVENSILAGKFNKSPGWYCKTCQFNKICV